LPLISSKRGISKLLLSSSWLSDTPRHDGWCHEAWAYYPLRGWLVSV
jgi:hypothetical protein